MPRAELVTNLHPEEVAGMTVFVVAAIGHSREWRHYAEEDRKRKAAEIDSRCRVVDEKTPIYSARGYLASR
jgi:hypothetical protein